MTTPDDSSPEPADSEPEASPADPADGGKPDQAEDDEAAPAADEGEQGALSAASPQIQSLIAPIDDDQPAGEDILYDEDFRALKAEIDTIGSATGSADYEQIVERARHLLTEKSKDLRVAGYLVVGEARLNGAEGAAGAVRGLRRLMDEYWETLFPDPSRMRGRGSALQFVADRLPEWIGAVSFSPEDRASLVSVRDDLEAIQAVGLEEMGEHAPSLSGLLRDLEATIDDLPEPESAPDSASAASAEATDEDSEDESTSTSAETEEPGRDPAPGDIASETDAMQAIRAAAAYYREEDLSAPVPYRLIRAVRWGRLRSVPPNEGGTTRLDPPREQRRNYLDGLLQDDKYESLVREGESSLQSGSFHLWLDLQRLLATALDELGEEYHAARDAVLFDLARLVDRLPGLLSLTFRDGTPFASPLSVDWIETEVVSVLGEDAKETGTGRDEETAPVREQYEAARQALQGGDLEGALAAMAEGEDRDETKRATFHRHLHLAQLCVKGDRLRIARPLLDELHATVEKHGLGEWAPSLALEVWTLRFRCYDRLAQQAPDQEAPALRTEADTSFNKVCLVDPTQALSLHDRRPA